MGRNLISVCDECKVQLMYLRNKESPNIQAFYTAHQHHENKVRTISDYVEDAPEDYYDAYEIYNQEEGKYMNRNINDPIDKLILECYQLLSKIKQESKQ